jgi:hypothetical protein
MTREQRLILIHLNNRLFEIEKQLRKEALEIINKMDLRVQDEADWINDYEIECSVEFYPKEDDPAYSEDDDDLLAEFSEGLSLLKPPNQSLLAGEENWNDQHIPDIDHPDQDEHHCWFYHQLYDHTKIEWEDILRIGDIWININLILQHRMRFP